jgi:hypothetical protein
MLMSEEKEILIPEKAGLQDYRRLLSMVENEITKVAPKVTQYKIDRGNARSKYDDALSTAKIIAMQIDGIKPNHQTMINAIANGDTEVKRLKQLWLDAKAVELKAIDRLTQLQGQRDTLKAMVKSEQISY